MEPDEPIDHKLESQCEILTQAKSWETTVGHCSYVHSVQSYSDFAHYALIADVDYTSGPISAV